MARSPHGWLALGRGPGTTHSNAAAEAELRWVKGQWAGRASCYRNETRTNPAQMTTMYRLGGANVKEWSRIIRAATGRAGGRPHGTLRSICDPLGSSSLKA